jgi:hypothetical protein
MTQDKTTTTKTSADEAARAAAAKLWGEHFLKYTLAGLGTGISGANLYKLISSVNKAPAKYTKFGPGAKTVDEDEKLASLQGIYDAAVSAPGKLLQSLPVDTPTKDALGVSAVLGGTGLGLYGGVKLVNALAEKRRKEELQEQVDDAKAQYQKALTGKKHAEALDRAFDMYKAADGSGYGIRNALAAALNTGGKLLRGDVAGTALDAAALPFKILQQSPAAYNAYVASVLGTGALASKMTYDWTRARSKDKAIENAQKVRARLSGTAPIYVDPDQLAAIKSVAS